MHCVIALPDRRIISASADGTVRVWVVTSKQCQHVLSGHYGPVLTVAAMQNGMVASGSCDEEIKIWNINTATCTATLKGHAGDVTSITSLENGWLVSASVDKTIKVWKPRESVATASASDPLYICQGTLRGHSAAVVSVACLPGLCVLTGSEDKTVAMWDVATLSCISVFAGHDNAVPCVVGLPGGRLASGSTDVKIWDPVVAGSEEQSKQLTREFNSANQMVKHIPSPSVWSNTQTGLKSFVATVFAGIGLDTSKDLPESVANDEPAGSQGRAEANLAYAVLSTKYPSTIAMFANNTSNHATRRANNFTDGNRHTTQLVNVLFAGNNDQARVTDQVDANVLWTRIKEWRIKLRKRKGPKIMHWLGIFKAQRAQQLVTRLDELCRNSGVERVTYLSVKTT